MPLDPHTPPPLLAYSPPELKPRRAGKGFMAVCGTLGIWGLGHLLCGRTRRALGWFVLWVLLTAGGLVCLAVPRLLVGFFVLAPLQMALLLAAAVDAFVTGRRSEQVWVPRAWQRYALGVALLVATGLLNHLLRKQMNARLGGAFTVSTRSMSPTLLPRDHMLVTKRQIPRRWDLVVFHPPPYPQQVFVQRVAGLPGEKVEIVNGQVRINDLPVIPPDRRQTYLERVGLGDNGCRGNPIVLGPDEYFLLGDNTTAALDSRWWTVSAPGHQPGAVPAAAIEGVVRFVYWPPARWHRF